MLTVIGGQSRHPDAIVGVDVGSSDSSAHILAQSLGHDRVVQLERNESTGFGAAVAAGLNSGVLRFDADETFNVETTEWIWLLHDDSAPSPDCLEQLLAAADSHPAAVVLGPKALGWHDRRLLLELGFSITGSGRRVTGLERREHDQGQHDDRGAVHAVGSAGMLIRRDVWDQLGGFDANIPLYRDDLDFCWRAWRAGHEVRVVPEAVIHHREASYHGRRADSAAPGRGHRMDRRAALHVLMTQTPGWRLPFTAIRLAFGSLLRSLLYLLGKDLRRAGDEVLALGSLIAHPGRLADARRRTKSTSVMSSHQAVHDLRPRASSQVRAAVEALGGIMATGRGSGASGGALESGPVSDDADLFEDPTGGWLRRTLGRPAVAIVLGLVAVTLIAGRGLWWGDGVLFGGALLPAPDGAADLWSTYLQAWHDVGPGSVVPTATAVAILATLSTALIGKASLTVGLVLLLAPAAAGLSAWFSLRGVIDSRGIRAWAAVAYGLLPAMTAAIAGGRLGVLLALVMLPWVARLVVRSLAPSVGAELPPASGRTAWAAALAVALAAAGAPIVWVWVLVAVVAAVIVAAIAQRPNMVLILRGIVVVAAPLLLLLPWSTHLLTNPGLFFIDVGALDPSLTAPESNPWQLALLDPGGPGTPATWVGIGIVLAALAALLRPHRRAAVVTAWIIGLGGLVSALALWAIPVTVPSLTGSISAWPGMSVALMGGALIVAAALAADGLRDSMAGSTFTWRQPVAAVATVAAVVTPLACAVLVLPGISGPVHRGDPVLLPPFVAAEAIGPEAPRTLILAPRESSVGYTLINGSGPQLGDGSVAPPAEDWLRLDRLVSGLVSGRGGDEVFGLADYAVRYVIVQTDGPLAQTVTRTLDAAPGLRRVAGQDGEVLWRVQGDTSRVRLVTDDDVEPLPVSSLTDADPFVEASALAGPATIALAQTADSVWQAELDGALLAAESVDGLQTFSVPAGGDATVSVTADNSDRSRWLWIQLIAVAVVIVLALPGRRLRDDDDVADDQVDEDDVEVLAADGIEVTS